jgi:hypothetical protein
MIGKREKIMRAGMETAESRPTFLPSQAHFSKVATALAIYPLSGFGAA